MVMNEMDVANAIELALEASESNEMTLLELVKAAVPLLSEGSIKQYITFVVDGVSTKDWSMKVSKSNIVKVVPVFAGGSF